MTKARVLPESHIAYMCMTDYEIEVPHGGAALYPSIEVLKELRQCVSECGIVEVEVRLRNVVQEADYSECSSKKAVGSDDEKLSDEFARHFEAELKRHSDQV